MKIEVNSGSNSWVVAPRSWATRFAAGAIMDDVVGDNIVNMEMSAVALHF